MLVRIAEIVYYMQKRQYQKANDSYLRLSIGNAPWPIGVTMVGYVFILFVRSSDSQHLIYFLVSMNAPPAKRFLQTRLLTCWMTKWAGNIYRASSGLSHFFISHLFFCSFELSTDAYSQAIDILPDKIPTRRCFTAYGIVVVLYYPC